MILRNGLVFRSFLSGAVCAALLSTGAASHAASIVHTTTSDFAAGISDGVVVPLSEPAVAGSGAVGVLPGLGTSLLNEGFSYTSQTQAEAAGWLFLLPNTADYPELADNPSSFSFPTDPAGNLRMRVSRPQDLWNTGVAGQRSPVMVLKDTPLTGDFVVETKIVQEPRLAGENRHAGIFIGLHTPFEGTALDVSSSYLLVGPSQDRGMTTVARFYSDVDPWPHGVDSQELAGPTAFIRVVKRGQYFNSYMKTEESAPWIFHRMQQIPPLEGTAEAPLVVGVFAKSWGGVTDIATRYRNIDVDYLRVNQVGSLSGAYTNIFDATDPVNWQTVSYVSPAHSGVKYQLRTGNTLTGGTVSDGGPFAGPDGTANTYFEDDAAQVVPNATGKRFLEYRLAVDAAAPNLPPVVRQIAATYQPGGLDARLASTAAEFGADAGGTQVQPGNGDLSLARTQVFRDDFTGSLAAGWQQYLGNPFEPGEITVAERSGYLRMKVGANQNLWVGAEKTGGLRLLRDIPAGVTDFEIETEVDMQTQLSRIGQVVLWQDENNWVTIGATQRFWDSADLGPIVEPILGDLDRGVTVQAYGTNTIQLRIARRGQVITLSYRDAASPSWRVARVLNATGLATGGADFVPTKVGLMSRSYGLTAKGPVNHDFNYFAVSSLTPTGTRDLAFTLPAGQRLDMVAAYGDGLTAANARFQLRNAGGTFVGPDGTAATFFTANEPRIPADLNPGTSQTLRVQMDAATGVPYLHAAGIQFATGDTCVARDANAADFAAGLVKTGVDLTTTPGVVTPIIGLGTTINDEFTYASNAAAVDNGPWTWVNPSGKSSYSFTEAPGSFRMNVARTEDLWVLPTLKNFVFLHRDEPVSGDWEIETVIRHPNGREDLRHDGLGVFGSVNNAIDVDNFLLYGPILLDAVEFASVANNVAATGLHGGYNGTVHYLRMRKTGNVFETWARTDPTAEWTPIDTRTNPNLNTAYVGMLAKSWGSEGTPLAADYDYFKFSPVFSTGTLESRVLELAGGCPVPFFSAEGTNLPAVQFQFRAADTTAELATLPFVGSDLTAGTFYPGDYKGTLAGQLSGRRYYQYRATLTSATSLNNVAIIGLASGTVPFTRADVVSALRVAGGLAAGKPGDTTRYDVMQGTSAGRVDITDVAAILRTIGGM